MNTYFYEFDTKLCKIVLAGNEKGLSLLHMATGEGKRGKFIKPIEWKYNKSFFKDVELQVNEYFQGLRRVFDVELNIDGTKFQKKIWNELMKIPYGELKSYKDIAIASGNKNASRAVGMANSKNKIPLIIPCHRVISSNGDLAGFAHGVDIKKRLIKHEELNSKV